VYPTHTRTREAAAHTKWGPQDARAARSLRIG